MILDKKLTRTCDDSEVAERVSFELGQSEFVGLLRHTGTDSNIIMKMLTGHLMATSGCIGIDGFNLNSQRSAIPQPNGYQPMNDPLCSERAGIDCLDCAVSLHRVPENKHPDRIGESGQERYCSERQRTMKVGKRLAEDIAGTVREGPLEKA
ncbi:MAG: hypothetical protein JAY84_09790 [Candidatus Thiodiazotropha taylori]|nr:hypothetical protein [Candidatus Thiodiazotropha taylori]MCG8068146.1 hypothetical protein [Candidatus Thiodiazotropha taylori]